MVLRVFREGSLLTRGVIAWHLALAAVKGATFGSAVVGPMLAQHLR